MNNVLIEINKETMDNRLHVQPSRMVKPHIAIFSHARSRPRRKLASKSKFIINMSHTPIPEFTIWPSSKIQAGYPL